MGSLDGGNNGIGASLDIDLSGVALTPEEGPPPPFLRSNEASVLPGSNANPSASPRPAFSPLRSPTAPLRGSSVAGSASQTDAISSIDPPLARTSEQKEMISPFLFQGDDGTRPTLPTSSRTTHDCSAASSLFPGSAVVAPSQPAPSGVPSPYAAPRGLSANHLGLNAGDSSANFGGGPGLSTTQSNASSFQMGSPPQATSSTLRPLTPPLQSTSSLSNLQASGGVGVYTSQGSSKKSRNPLRFFKKKSATALRDADGELWVRGGERLTRG